jgi:hypothetical protein
MYNFFFLFLRTSGGNTIVNDVKHHCYMLQVSSFFEPLTKIDHGFQIHVSYCILTQVQYTMWYFDLGVKFLLEKDCWLLLEKSWKMDRGNKFRFLLQLQCATLFLNLPKGHFACMKSATLQTMHTLWFMVQIITRNNCPHWEGILGRIKYQIYYY